MRPLRLVMTGFGPYMERTVIDFEQFGRGGMYLVTGDTGSGKTYIFDAITFALYGEMSGSSRDSSSVRSQYAGDDVFTEVELYFEYRGKRYKIVRVPDYMRRKKNSREGYTKQQAKAELTYPDGSIISGPSKVTDAVIDILSIDRNQFCSIAMIAQGEFRRLLTAGTDERQKLFRKLFNTHPYNKLMEELSIESKAIKTELDDRERDLRASFTAVKCSFDEEIQAELDAAAEAGFSSVSLEDDADILSRMIERGDSISASAAEEIAELDSIISLQGSKLESAEQNRNNLSKLESVRSETQRLSENIEKAEAASNAAASELPRIEKLEAEAVLLESNMSSYDELDSESKRLAELGGQLSERTDALNKKTEEKERLDSEVKEKEVELSILRSASEDLARLQAAIEKSEARTGVLKSLQDEISRAESLAADHKRLLDEFKPLEERAKGLELKSVDIRSAHMMEQAGILASELTDGVPCPVCGSTHHPDPAVLSSDAPTADDVELAEQKAADAREKSNKKLTEVQKAKGMMDEAETSARTSAVRDTGEEDLAKASELAAAELQSLGASLEEMRNNEAELEKKKIRASELTSVISEKKSAFANASAEADKLVSETASLKNEVAAAESKAETLRSRLAHDSREEAQKELDKKSAEARKLRDAITSTGKALNEAKSAKAENDARIKELENVVKGYEPVDEELARSQKADAEIKRSELSQTNITIGSETGTARAALSAIKAGSEDIKNIRKRHEIVYPLFRTAAGMLNGKDKITLEAYVQAVYFDRIIRHANLRLMMMSDGQYEFVRSEEASNRKEKFGLGLNIIDHYTGSERSVSTLSGGESFMASLSLALGLSDEIQSSSGGIKLDTMFIDEGFGSLDGETLENAIRTLTQLSDEEKLVGIISHVEALASRIDRQIAVSKDRISGSHVKLINR